MVGCFMPERTIKRDPFTEATTQQGTPATTLLTHHHHTGPGARGGEEAGHFFMPWPEIPLPRYLVLVFRPASSDASLTLERSPMKREEAMS